MTRADLEEACQGRGVEKHMSHPIWQCVAIHPSNRATNAAHAFVPQIVSQSCFIPKPGSLVHFRKLKARRGRYRQLLRICSR